MKNNLDTQKSKLANTRTLLSYTRTALLSVSVAFAFVKLDKQNPIDIVTIIFFAFAALFLIVGIIDFFYNNSKINKQ